MTNREDLIRARAHAMWEAEGCPDGRGDQHWQQATLDVEQAEREAAATPEPAEAAPAIAPPPGAKPARRKATAAAAPAKPRARRTTKS